MAKKDIKFTLDTIDSRYSPVGTVKQLDSVFFYIKITENGVTKDLTGQTIKLFAIKEDKKIVEQTTKINITNQREGLVEIELLNAAIQVHGFTYFELEISDSNGIISTADFILRVNKRVGSPEAIESTNEVSTLKEIEVYVAQAKQEIKEFKKLQDKMLKTNETINSNETARVDAEELRVAAEESRVTAELSRVKAENNRSSNIKQIRELLLKGTVDMEITSKEGCYLTQDGTFNSDSRLHCKLTNKVYCDEGWVFSYNGRADALAVSYLMYRGNTIVSFGQHNSKTEITIPKGIDGIVFASYNYKDRDIVLNVSLISPNIIIEDNLIPNLESKVGVSELNNDIRDVLLYTNTPITKDTMTKLENKYASVNGNVVTANGYCCYEIPVKEGEIYSYSGTIIYNLAPYHLCDLDKTVVVGGDKQQHSEITTFEYPYLIIPKGINRLRICSGSGKGDAPMTLIKKTPSPSLKSEDVEEAINSHVYEGLGELENITPRYSTQNGVYLRGDGTLATDSSGQVTDFINIDDLHTIYINAHAKYLTRILAIYDSEKSFLAIKGVPEEYNTSLIWNKEPIKIKTILKEHPNAKYIRIGTYQYKSHPIRIYQQRSTLVETIKYLEAKIDEVGKQSNILYGKKYVACGDSFTEGDFRGFEDEHGLTGTNSPVIYDEEMRCYKTYPWWIAKRNNMTLVNEAICGSTMALSKEYLEGTKDDINYRNPFSLKRYKQVPLDADYLTLWFGLNETSTPLGTLQDTDNRTILGAWNVVLEYFITNMPYCKIGIVISDGGLRDDFANGIISVAEYWGIPYLDLRNDPKIPLMLGGRGGNINLNPKAKQLRNKAFYVADDNGHPNLEAHKYQSTFIENWLRSL
ncbi:BppU family phage baseplate upper protein [Clostridium perfringens]|nr:BppU family phage baseplate upper protein [Clostridium perfringens]